MVMMGLDDSSLQTL